MVSRRKYQVAMDFDKASCRRSGSGCSHSSVGGWLVIGVFQSKSTECYVVTSARALSPLVTSRLC